MVQSLVSRFGVFSVVLALFWGNPIPDACAQAESIELTVYSYDSLLSKSGLGPALFSAFEKKTQGRIRIRGVSVGDSVQLLSRVKLDSTRGAKGADLVLGIDQQTWPRVKEFVDRAEDQPWSPRDFKKLKPQTRIEQGFIPFDYGVFAWMVDTQKLAGGYAAAPKTLEALLNSDWKRKLILEDPRTSAPGLGFLSWSAHVLGSSADVYWKSLRGQILTLPAGWDEAYGIFLKGEAPMVWSYTTSEAYHRHEGDPGRYRAVVFDQGNPIQIEGAAILKTTALSPEKRKAAREFIEFLISEEAQSFVPLKNWMLPAREGVGLPESFRGLPQPKKIWPLSLTAQEVESVLSRWSKAIRP